MLGSHSIKIADRVKELSYTMGTGNLVLTGPVPGFSSFGSAFAHNANVFYAVTDGTRYEVGSGVYISGVQNELKRFPFKSSNANNVVNFPEGIKEVYSTYPATHAVHSSSGIKNYKAPKASGLAYWGDSSILNYDGTILWDDQNKRLGINNEHPQYTIDIGGDGTTSLIKASGLLVGTSGIYFPPINNGDSSYAGGRQTSHYEPNRLDDYAFDNELIDNLTGSSEVLELSGVANNFILFKKQGAGLVFAGPPSGCTPPCSPGYPTFRQLTKEDLPELSSLYTGLDFVSGVSGILNNKIDSRHSTALSSINNVANSLSITSGILNSRIGSVSGILNSKVNEAYNIADTKISTVSGIVYAVSGMYSPSQPSNGSSTNGIFSQGRLTLESGVSVSTQDQTNKTYLYYQPHNGNQLTVFSGSNLVSTSFQTTPLLLSNVTSGSVYDVFGYLSGNNLSLELNAWTNSTTRNTAITYVSGVFVKSGDNSRRYLGTIRASNDGTAEDSAQKRFVWNMHNRVDRAVSKPTTSSWTYSSATWRNIGNVKTSIELVNGYVSDPVYLIGSILFVCDFSGSVIEYSMGFAIDPNLTPTSASLTSGYNSVNRYTLNDHFITYPTLGYSSYSLMEYGTGGPVPVLYTTYNNGINYGGIKGKWWC